MPLTRYGSAGQILGDPLRVIDKESVVSQPCDTRLDPFFRPLKALDATVSSTEIFERLDASCKTSRQKIAPDAAKCRPGLSNTGRNRPDL